MYKSGVRPLLMRGCSVEAHKIDGLKGSAIVVVLALAQLASAQFLYSAYSSAELLRALDSVQLTAVSRLVQRLTTQIRKV